MHYFDYTINTTYAYYVKRGPWKILIAATRHYLHLHENESPTSIHLLVHLLHVYGDTGVSPYTYEVTMYVRL